MTECEENLPVTLDWVRNQEKAELHVHLLGAIRPSTALEIAANNSIPFPISEERKWIPFFTRGDLAHFVEGFISLFEIIKTAEDLHRVVLEAAEDWANDGITYSEPRVTVTSHVARGLEADSLLSILKASRLEARRRFGIEIQWMVDFPRILGSETGWQALEIATKGMNSGIVGFDIAGYEGSLELDSEWRLLFQEAKTKGLRTTAHSGEIGSAAHVRAAVEDWGVERIGHGTRAVEDETVMDLLLTKNIPIEVNPTCNVLLGNVDSLGSHPLEVFRKRGIPITLNTDDPSLFGISLSEEIYRTAHQFGWDRQVTQSVIANGWRYRFNQPG